MRFLFRKLGPDQAPSSPNRSVLPGSDDDPLFIEQFKALRAKFEYRAGMLNCKLVAITSAIAGEGKTLSATNLASNLASAGGKKVLLIDADLRKSDIARVMRITPNPGLSEYLLGSVSIKDILRNSVIPGLYVIPGGMQVASPGDLLAGERSRAFLSEIRDWFDIILVDTPPIIPVSDTLAIRDLMDGFIFIYRSGFTPHALFREAVEEIGDKKILGVVLNGVEQRSHKYYQRYYGKYYRKQAAVDGTESSDKKE